MHHFFSMMFSLLAIIGHVSTDRPYISELKVSNGMSWGSWGIKSMCPAGTYAAGFSLNVESMVLASDDTALNGIRLYCVDQSRSRTRQLSKHVESSVGSFGDGWDANIRWCNTGYFTAFMLRVESYQGHGDDTAANNVRFKCSGGQELEADCNLWGSWGNWSPTCAGKGICGLQTRIEPRQGSGDDTALNDVIMFCCD